jgi:hypothetical protein
MVVGEPPGGCRLNPENVAAAAKVEKLATLYAVTKNECE